MEAGNNSFGTDEYIQRVLEQYSVLLIKLAFTYVKSVADAEDITQEVLISLMKRGIPFDSEEHEKAWLIRVTINKCKNHLKSAWLKWNVPLPEDLSYLPKEESEVLSQLLKLPTKYRSVLHLFYYENYSMEEIAKILGRKPATIGTWLSRGRNLLKAELTGGFDHE
jgi:RNA polymerase sigma factor, sigma-70 family